MQNSHINSTEIDFTYRAGNITASLINNSIDVSRIKTAHISNLNVASAIVQRDAAGSFTANAITAGSLSISSGGINISTAQTYKINNVEYLATKTTDNLTQGTTNTYYATSLFNADLNTKTTNNLTQGTTNKYYAASLFNTDLNTKTTDNLTQGTTDKYYSSTQAQTDAKTAISATDSTEIDFTYTAGNITASLINNSIDISRIKTSQLSNYSVANSIVQRDGSGSFSVNALSASSINTSFLSLNYNGVSGTYLKATANYSASPLALPNHLYIDTDNNGTLYLNQNVSNATLNVAGTATMSGALTASQGINIPTGQTYKINNVEYLATKTTDNLTQGTTNKYYSSAQAILDAKTAISATEHRNRFYIHEWQYYCIVEG